MGAVLEQWNENTWELLGFFSKKFSDAQRRYSTYDRELQAIYSGIKFFQHMVEGRTLTVKMEHKPITFAFKQKAEKVPDRQLRQLDYIGQFTTNIVYIAGEHNITVDALSRIGNIDMPIMITTEDLAVAKRDDDELQTLLQSETALVLCKLRVDNTESTMYCDVAAKEIRPDVPRVLRKRVFDMTHGLSRPSH